MDAYIIKLCLLYFFLLNITTLQAQEDSCWSLLVLQKGASLVEQEDMTSYSPNGFYIYRNCIYDIETKTDKYYKGRIIDLRPDSIFMTNSFNEEVAEKKGKSFDTVGIATNQIAFLKLSVDRYLDRFEEVNLKKHNFIFQKSAKDCRLESRRLKIYRNTNEIVEIVPHLGANGLDYLFENGGYLETFEKTGILNPYFEVDSIYRKRWPIWLTPSKVEEINGIAIGFWTDNVKNDGTLISDSLMVNGINVELHIGGFYVSIYDAILPGSMMEYPDSIKLEREWLEKVNEVKINGVNISISALGEVKQNGISIIGTSIYGLEVNGLEIVGLSSQLSRKNGLSIVGLYNRAAIMNGLQIGLINKSTQVRGVQAGLVNIAHDLRGFQFGLWNKNGKRSLPFINWQFKKKKNKKSK